MRRLRPFVIASIGILMSGCSIFPYSEKFGCENMNQYGRCLDVKDAYEMAVTGEVKGEPIQKKGQSASNQASVEVKTSSLPTDPEQQYHNERYRKLSSLVESPDAPMVAQPDVVRTLVLNYSDRGRSGAPLYGHRFIYFFGSDPEWVLGPTMKTEQAPLLNDIVQ